MDHFEGEDVADRRRDLCNLSRVSMSEKVSESASDKVSIQYKCRRVRDKRWQDEGHVEAKIVKGAGVRKERDRELIWEKETRIGR